MIAFENNIVKTVVAAGACAAVAKFYFNGKVWIVVNACNAGEIIPHLEKIRSKSR